MSNTNGTAQPIAAGGIDPDDLRPGYQVEVHDQSVTNVDGISTVVQVFPGNGRMTYPEARERLNEIGRRRPELHRANSPVYLAVAPAHRGGHR